MGNNPSDIAAVRDRNRDAWNAERYDAWVSALGTPQVEAAAIVADPAHKLRRLLPHMGEVAGKRVCSVQGSQGRIAVALARLGAEATVLDFAEENQRYAMELAAAAGVAIHYHVGDVMEAGALGLAGRFDWLVLELGILHYHQDLTRFFAVLAELAAPGGRLLLNEFHPVQRKLFAATPGMVADYFHTELVEADVPNPVGDGRSLGTCAYRFWTLGEIVNAVIAAGFSLERLDEHPDWTDPTIPGAFTLLARAFG
jgi:2-polyprenyl-3-methyl-5-hydroxy-6-metoxy-1,4-benzoquinol methylase